MSDTIGQQVSDLQTRIEAATREHARAEGARDAAKAAAQAAHDELLRDFGVPDIPAAQAPLHQLHTELEQIVAAVRRLLDDAEEA